MPAGLITFPGVDRPERADMTLSHGVTPSVCIIELEPQPDFLSEGGDLVFTYGETAITFTDCKVDRGSFRVDQSGWVIQLAVWDRRWRWAFGDVSGSYNTRLEDGTFDLTRKQDPSYLMSVLLDAMGEQDYDLSKVPVGVWPEVNWDYDNPAQMLAQLADELGCRVILHLDDTVSVEPVGSGQALPDDGPDSPIEADSLAAKLPQRPDLLRFVGGRTRFQIEITLRAVGLDTDGTIKKINSLSYMPTSGWGYVDLQDMTAVGVSQADIRQREFLRTLARDTVFRWYQIALEINDDNGNPYRFNVPGFGEVTRVKQLLLLESMVELMQDADGHFRAKPAEVVGMFADERLGSETTEDGTIYWGGFSIDAERGLVQFSAPVYQINDAAANGAAFQEAAIRLITAAHVRDPDTWAWIRYTRDLQLNPGGNFSKVYKHGEAYLAVLPVYDDSGNLESFTTNTEALNAEADAYLQAALDEFQTGQPQERTYSGLVPIDPDGAIQQVSWSVGPDGCMTRASRNCEWDPNVATYRVRRVFEALRHDYVAQMGKRVNEIKRRLDFRPFLE
jgi:hypothetical protein